MLRIVVVIASIPSPTSDTLNLGFLSLRYYGMMIALGVLVAVWLARKRLAALGDDPEIISDLALFCVPAGLVGARLYHVITDWNSRYSGGRWWPDAFLIWKGGLGIPGGIALGFAVGVWYVRRHNLSMGRLMDAVAPALPIAQAIGRMGNYFNQELFGRPTDLPWKLEITKVSELDALPERYLGERYFHPTFLYEGLWNVTGALLLILMGNRLKLRQGKLFPAYITMYFLGRMWVEELRIDPAARVGDLRWNFVLSIIMVVFGLVWFFWGGFRASEEELAERAAYIASGPHLQRGGPSEGVGELVVDSSSDGATGAEDQLAEGGPESDSPVSERPVAESDEGHTSVGIDPDETAAGAEVAERSD